jgi:hypothetical protein
MLFLNMVCLTVALAFEDAEDPQVAQALLQPRFLQASATVRQTILRIDITN